MSTLTIVRGLPGSGKTTWARAQPGHVRVSRDDLRAMLHGGMLGLGWAERQVSIAEHTLVDALLRAGLNVISDNTNLNGTHVRVLTAVARAAGAEVVVRDFTDVDVAECVARDAARPVPVGEEVIRAMWRRYLRPR
ncbi:MAG: hypothetical protein V7603_860 [Micromonosporaceae bacterium]